MDHLKGRSSNLRLQKAFKRHEINKFDFVVYAFAKYSVPLITDMETLFMSYFPPWPHCAPRHAGAKAREMLYNFKFHATTMLGYKHREETKALISKPGVLNPMFGKTHTEKTKALLSSQKSNPLAQ